PFDDWRLTALRIALTVVAAEVSWRLVERPLRRPRTSGRGVAARRYRRAELVLAVAMPLMVVPYFVSGRPPADLFESVASPGSNLGSQPTDDTPAVSTTAPPGTTQPTTVPADTVTDPAVTTTPTDSVSPTTVGP